MNKQILILALGAVISFTGCKKEAGSGGTSAITGHITAKEYATNGSNSDEAEITQIIIPNGEDIADGDYILLNTPAGGTLYYLWFKWNNGVQPDPNLAGRTGIQVTFDFTETNSMVATDERVYLIYGDEEYYSESVRTDANGNYRFSGLNRGDYTIFVFSMSLSDGSTTQVESSVTISEKKSIVSAPGLNIIK